MTEAYPFPTPPIPRKPRWKAPPGATDTHFHIFGPSTRYPFVGEREYTPPDELPEAYRRLIDTLGIERAVLVQPSVYGTDNSCQLDAAAKLGIRARVIVVVPPDTPDKELVRLHESGARGVRFILAHIGGLSASEIERFTARVKDMGWHLQFLMRAKQMMDLEPKLAKLSTHFVIDHMGYVRPSEGGLDQPAFRALLRLLEGGHCWVKFTGIYRISTQIPLYQDVIPFARALVKARPDRLLWGSDWPHAMSKGAEFKMPNTADLFDLLTEWGDEKVRKQILVDNPAKLFGF